MPLGYQPLATKLAVSEIFHSKKLLATFRNNFQFKFGSVQEEERKPQTVKPSILRTVPASEYFSAIHDR